MPKSEKNPTVRDLRTRLKRCHKKLVLLESLADQFERDLASVRSENLELRRELEELRSKHGQK